MSTLCSTRGAVRRDTCSPEDVAKLANLLALGQSAFDLLDRECKGARVAFVRVRGGSVVWAAAADRATRTFCTNLPPPSHTQPHRRSDERRGGAIVRALR